MQLSIAWILVALLGGGTSARAAAESQDEAPASAPLTPNPLQQGLGLELNRALRQARRRDCDAELIVAKIAKLGPDALPASLLVLDECGLPAIDGAEAQITSELQEKLLLDALTRWEAGFVWAAVENSIAVPKGKEATLCVRRAAILAAGSCALPTEVKRLAAIALLPNEKAVDTRIEGALLAAAKRVYARKPEGLTALANSWNQFRPPLLPAILKAAGAGGNPRALEFLAQMLNQSNDLRAVALAELARQRAPTEFPAGLLENLRALLDPDYPMPCQSACSAIASLGDYDSVDALVELLSAPSDGIRASAYGALCRLSGISLPPQETSWHVWRVQEGAWFEEREPTLLSDIEEGSEQAAQDAMLEMSAHRWERHRLSDIVAEGLNRPEESVRGLACSVLGQLGSPRARAALQKFLLDGSDCATEAQNALGRCSVL